MTTTTPLVSIIMAAYNAERFIGESVRSIMQQQYTNWELLIVDDDSQDHTWDILQSFQQQDARIRILRLPSNQGAGVARNRALQETQGSIIAFCDSDDQWLPHKLTQEIAFMQTHACDAVYASYFTCTEDGTINGLVHCRPMETAFSIKCDDKIGNLTFMYNAQHIGKLPIPSLRKRQDWVYKMLILEQCHQAYGIAEPLAIYRHRKGSISNSKLSLIPYNIVGYTLLGWSKWKATLFFLLFFVPSYSLKICTHWIHRNDYKQYI